MGQQLILFVRDNIVIVHHAANSKQMSFSSAHMKFANRGCTNTSFMRANEHYAANLRSSVKK
jgi:hypothetical protein